MPRVRLEDVARAAGVSKSTASRALNDPTAPLREETRARVRQAVEELAYRPHAGARALKRADTGALGLAVPDLTNPVWARIVRGAVKPGPGARLQRAADRGRRAGGDGG